MGLRQSGDGNKKAVEGDGALRGGAESVQNTCWGPKAFEEHGLYPVLSSKWREELHFPTSAAAPVCQQGGGLPVSRSREDMDDIPETRAPVIVIPLDEGPSGVAFAGALELLERRT